MLKVVVLLTCSLVMTSVAYADDPAPGECASGFCGTPNNNGGGGCGCGGGSILVNNTDFGVTYSTSDDYDADGFEDDSDVCPFIANRDQADSDGDGVGNACDNAPNLANKDQKDTDGDGLGDVIDDDVDGDKIPNATDNCQAVRNASQLNTDGDALGDACDGDIDGDGQPNATDPCPLRTDNSVTGASCDADADMDHRPDSIDNCLEANNPGQEDLDGDGIGDACDFDVDGDNILNSIDNCAKTKNLGQVDADRDGAGDECDPNGFCFIAAKNPAATCLDPESAFQVTAGPAAAGETGVEAFLAMYSNRANHDKVQGNVNVKYTFTILERPANSTAVISNPRGATSTSDAFEYRFDDSRRPKFTPDVAGSYKIGLTAELVDDDQKFPGAKSSDSFATIEVTGPTKSHGCSAAGVELAWVAGALVMAARRLRRRA